MPISTAPQTDLPPFATGSYAGGGFSWSGTARRVATDIVTFAAAGLTPNLRTRAQSMNEWLARVQEWYAFLRGEAGTAKFGDGSDGDQTYAAGSHSLVRDIYCDDMTVAAGARVNTQGFRIFVLGTLTVEATGVIQNNGAHASGTTGGVGGVAGSLAAGGDGANGLLNTDNTPGPNATTLTIALGGAGGTGGTADVHAGGTSTATAPAASLGGYRHAHAAFGRASGSATSQWTGGAGGGAGASDTANGTSGAGGGGGGVVSIFARRIYNLGTIRANGGNGSDGTVTPGSGSAGGGGGGGGGVVFVVHREAVGGTLGTVQANGGTGGADATSNTTATDGAAGSAGRVITVIG